MGVDLLPQPRYPFPFYQGDALTFSLDGFDAVHASPPCQHYSSLRHLHKDRAYPDLIAAVRDRVSSSGLPYVLENVVGSPLVDSFQLCGTSFGVPMRRHRRFESSIAVLVPPCAHKAYPRELPPLFRTPVSMHSPRSRYVGVYGGTRSGGDGARARQVMGIDWMTRAELTQAVPPAYTELIGSQLMRHLQLVGRAA